MNSELNQLQVGLGERAYAINIGQGTLANLGNELRKIDFPRKIALISNQVVADFYAEDLKNSLVDAGFTVSLQLIPDGEQYKSLDTFERVIEWLINDQFDRKTGLIALGGGVVGDLVGFVAASYLRGIPFVQVPTTLLAQVDSSVGGKTAVNHPLGKNLIGAFYQPRHVQVDVETLKTLTDSDFRSGLAEVVKYGVISDHSFFQWLIDHSEALIQRKPEALIYAVTRSCQIKADIVERDEREQSIRAYLNFGHTIGHAVEKLTGYGSIKHGEAVAVGMVAASRISEKLQLCTSADTAAIENLLKRLELDTHLPTFSLSDYVEVMFRDKKVSSGTLRFILNHGIGQCGIHEIEDLVDLMKTTFVQFQ